LLCARPIAVFLEPRTAGIGDDAIEVVSLVSGVFRHIGKVRSDSGAGFLGGETLHNQVPLTHGRHEPATGARWDGSAVIARGSSGGL